MTYKALTLILLSACLNTQFMLGGFEKESCDGNTMLGSPVNSFQILNNTISTIMDAKNKDKKFNLLYFGSAVVAGTNYRIIFESSYEYMDNTTTKYFAFEIYVPLPAYQQPPDINKLLISEDKDEVLNFFELSEKEAGYVECERDLKDVYNKLIHGDVETKDSVKKEAVKGKKTVDGLISRIDKLLRTTLKDLNEEESVGIQQVELPIVEEKPIYQDEAELVTLSNEPKPESVKKPLQINNNGDASSKSKNETIPLNTEEDSLEDEIDLPFEQTGDNLHLNNPFESKDLDERSYFNSSSIAVDDPQLNNKKYYNQPRQFNEYDAQNYSRPSIGSD